MTVQRVLRGTCSDFVAALQFLTRIPISSPHAPDSLARAVKFFPAVGLLIGASAALLNMLLVQHLSRFVSALIVVTFLVLITGGLHEDGLADAADAFGGGSTREQILAILKDSRIGSYGGATLTLSLVARVALLGSLPQNRIAAYLIAAHVLCRWTTLPLAASSEASSALPLQLRHSG
jgi:adenosylcobinamide-GDP ribazoletransferase